MAEIILVLHDGRFSPFPYVVHNHSHDALNRKYVAPPSFGMSPAPSLLVVFVTYHAVISAATVVCSIAAVASASLLLSRSVKCH
jgi:hypothetical protein